MKKKKLIVSFLIIILIIFLGVFFYTKNKIENINIKEYLITHIEKNLKGSKVGSLNIKSFSVGFKVRIRVESLTIYLKKNKIPLLNVKEIYIKTPILPLLFSKSSVNINLDSPKIFYISTTGESNWNKTLKNSEKREKKSNVKFMTGFAYLSKINIRLNNAEILYKTNKNNANLKINRLQIKNFNLNSNTAYEIYSDININKLKFKASLIGQINISKFIKEQAKSNTATFNIRDFSFSNFNYPIQDTNFNVDFVKSSGSILIKIAGNLLGKNKLNSRILFNKDKIDINDFNLNINLFNLMRNFKSKLLSINDRNANLKITGKGFFVNSKSWNMNLRFTSSDNISAKVLMEDINFNFKGNYNKDKYHGSLLVKAMGGNIIGKIAGNLYKNTNNFNMKIDINNTKISKDFINYIFYNNAVLANRNKSNSISKNNKSKTPRSIVNRGDIYLNLNNVKLNNRSFHGKASILFSPNEIDLNYFKFKYLSGRGEFKNRIFSTGKYSRGNFYFKSNKLDISLIDIFLPKQTNVKGLTNGSIKGEYSLLDKVKYSIKSDIEITGGNLNSLVDLKSYLGKITEIVKKVPNLSANDYFIKTNYEKIYLKGNFKNNNYKIDKFSLHGSRNNFKLNANGNINKSGRSYMFVYLYDKNKMSNKLQKIFSTDTLPIKFEGTGDNLKPNYGFTISALTKSSLKKKGKKAIGKLLKGILK